VGQSQVHTAADGTVFAGDVSIGKFKVVDFGQDQEKLVAAGNNCFYMPDAEAVPQAAEGTVVKQGFTEASNVNVVDALVDMIMVTRLYEANMKAIAESGEASNSLLSVAAG
jgi:flagellar basal-body rod protein FlgG